MNQDVLFLKAHIHKLSLESKAKNWKVQKKLQTIDEMLAKVSPTPRQLPQIILESPKRSNPNPIQIARHILSRRKNEIDPIYEKISKEHNEDDEFNHLIIDQIEKSQFIENDQPSTLRIQPQSTRPKINNVPDLFLLPKIAQGQQVKRKREIIKQLDFLLKSDQKEVQKQAVAEVNNQKLTTFYNYQLYNLKNNPEYIKELVVKNDYFQKRRKLRLESEPTISTKSQDILNKIDLQKKLYQVHKRSLYQDIQSLQDGVYQDYNKLAKKNSEFLF